MYLHKLVLNLRCREARRDLANPYEMHSTLCRAFSPPEQKCPGGTFLWRLETPIDRQSNPHILVQSCITPDWTRINDNNWFEKIPNAPVDIQSQLTLKNLQLGQSFRFRLRANPSVCRAGKRFGLFQNEDQIKWFVDKSLKNGFQLSQFPSFTLEDSENINILISQGQMLRGQQRCGHEISVYSVLYDGILTVTNPEKFLFALKAGIGHGKTMGLGLLSVVPLR